MGFSATNFEELFLVDREIAERFWCAKCFCTEEIPLKCTCFDPENLADFDDGNYAIDPSKQ